MIKLDIEQAEPIRKKFTPDWEIRKGKYLYKKVAFDDYNQVLRFLMAIEQPQIKLDHFADFMNFYNELTIAITTHDINGLTQLDFELALYIDKALDQMGARQLDEISAKDIGAGALAGLMALTPVSKAFSATQNTDPLPNKQTTTMVQKDVAGKKDLSKIQAKDVLQLRIVLDSGEELDLGPYKGKQHAYKQFKEISKMITNLYKKKGASVPSWKMYKGDTLIGQSRSTGQ